MAPTNYYVDPAIDANSGTGTSGDPFGDLQYALNTVTRDATNGDQFNIKAGTSEVLGAALSLATYGTPTAAAVLIFRGYTAAAGDGGIGVISGNNTYSVFNSSTLDHIHWYDLRLTNCGSNPVVRMDQYGVFVNVKVDLANGYGLYLGANNRIINCMFTDTTVGVRSEGASNYISKSYFVNGGTRSFSAAISDQSGRSFAIGNVFKLSGSTVGIDFASGVPDGMASHNTFWANAGTGCGINIASGSAPVVVNNIFEGFSGTGGAGIKVASGGILAMEASNAYYNNTTNVSLTGKRHVDFGNNDTLSATPFVNAASADFAISGTQTGVTEDAYPTTFNGSSTTNKAEKGAAQAGAGTGGAVAISPFRGNIG